jgi:hypothetical protein
MNEPPDKKAAALPGAATNNNQSELTTDNIAKSAAIVKMNTRPIRLRRCRHCQRKIDPPGAGGTPLAIGGLQPSPRARVTALPRDYSGYALEILRECEQHFWDDEWEDARELLGAHIAPYGIWPGLYPYGIGFARVRFHGDTFDLDDEGVPALLLGVPDEYRDVVDLFAAELDAGNRVATLGLKSWCLGEPNIRSSNCMGGALRVHETLWEWLASGGDGIFITNYRRAARRLDDNCILRVKTKNESFGDKFDQMLRASLPIPEIFVEVPAT